MTLIVLAQRKIFSNNMRFISRKNNYGEVYDSIDTLESVIEIPDHLGGFDSDMNNALLDFLNNYAIKHDKIYTVVIHILLRREIKAKYSNIQFGYKIPVYMWKAFDSYTVHPPQNYKNFICCFNGAPNPARKCLIAILKKFNYFNTEYCSKNFAFSVDELDGYIADCVGDRQPFYNKFFISNNSDEFFQTVYSFGYDKFQHGKNIYNLESKLSESFLNIIGETIPQSYHPLVTEKFLYSIVTRGLFLTYGQAGWHDFLEEYYGFRNFRKIFDYSFDQIQNPVERLVALMSMISKFSHLTPAEWQDLYQLEYDTIEYNYNHYFSGKYLEYLK
jgi:hypothetical protein